MARPAGVVVLAGSTVLSRSQHIFNKTNTFNSATNQPSFTINWQPYKIYSLTLKTCFIVCHIWFHSAASQGILTARG